MEVPPSREDVEDWWRGVLAGRCSREQAHAWARHWVEGWDEVIDDPIISLGLQQLHGLDLSVDGHGSSVMRHGGGPGRAYVRSENDVRTLFLGWLGDSAAFDADPVAWRRRRFGGLLRAVWVEEGADRAHLTAQRLVARGLLSIEDAARILAE